MNSIKINSIIQTHNLTKNFRNEAAVDSLDFTLEPGEICALIGKNGAGKSTFFKMLSGQIIPTEGEIQLFGKTGKESAHARTKFGFMIEEPQFFPDFSARQNLEYFRIQRGVAEKSRIDEVLEIVGLHEQQKKKFKQYSMGMKQRLGLALCLLSSPDCLVLDEPTNGLDAQAINEIRRLLLKLNQEEQITILISSHILSELQLLATRFVFINNGALVEDISQAELHEKGKKQLRIQVSESSKAAQLLERSYSDIEYKVLPDNWITIQNHVDESAEINRLLNSHEVAVAEFHVEDMSLEEYFLGLVGAGEDD